MMTDREKIKSFINKLRFGERSIMGYDHWMGYNSIYSDGSIADLLEDINGLNKD
jgi:hypothetical protein